uniref:Uncharacterized protein n=1 Tax=Anguilla anguilla TaxID=7936 RepID=A0A0E9SP17_ANGAN
MDPCSVGRSQPEKPCLVPEFPFTKLKRLSIFILHLDYISGHVWI